MYYLRGDMNYTENIIYLEHDINGLLTNSIPPGITS
jgi:hypothetical protein